MKLAVALAVLFLATAAQADSTVVVDVTASQCNGCHPDVNLLPTALNAQFTLEQVTGTFFNSGGSFSFYGTEWEVIGINGTLNGYPMALSTGPQGQASWLLDSAYPLEDYALGTVYFTVDGSFAWLENDNEFNLLEVLLREAGRVVPRERLVNAVLSRKFSPFDRSIDMHVSKVRKKLGDTDADEHIKTIRGVGYIFARPREKAGEKAKSTS